MQASLFRRCLISENAKKQCFTKELDSFSVKQKVVFGGDYYPGRIKRERYEREKRG